jgi:uncharacterized protein (DUF4213/DUF364 family)
MKTTWKDLVGPLPTWPNEVVMVETAVTEVVIMVDVVAMTATTTTTTTLVDINAREDEAQVGVIIPPIKYARELATPQIGAGIASMKNMFLKREL